MLSNVEHVSIESAALAKHRLHHRAVLSKAFDVRMPSHVRRFCQISRHLTAPSNHLVCLLAPLDHIGSHWITLAGSCNRGCWVFYFCSASYQTQPLDDPAALRTAVLRGDREASNLHSHLALSAFRWVNFQVCDHADEALQSNSVSEAMWSRCCIQDHSRCCLC